MSRIPDSHLHDNDKEWRWRAFQHAHGWRRAFVRLIPARLRSEKWQVRSERLLGTIVLAAPLLCYAVLSPTQGSMASSKWDNALDMQVDAHSRTCPRKRPIKVVLANRTQFHVNEYMWRIEAYVTGHSRLQNYSQPMYRSDRIIPPNGTVSFCEPIPVLDHDGVRNEELEFRPGYALAYSVSEDDQPGGQEAAAEPDAMRAKKEL